MTAHDPHSGITDALGQLSDETRRLVGAEVNQARDEFLDRLRAAAPAVPMLAGAGALGLFAGASGYRAVMRILERIMSPPLADLVATAGFAAGAGALASAGVGWLRQNPPLPTETVQATADAVGEAAENVQATREQPGA